MSTFTLQDLDLPMTAEEAIKAVEQAQHAEPPQPTQMGEVLPKPDLQQILKTIGEQFALLSTVITQHQGNSPNTTPPEGNPPSLQETIELVLQQSDWFKGMVHETVADMDFGDELETQAERYCENYFSYSFDPRDHFDIDEAVADRVDDKLEDIVAEKVAESLEEVVAEKLSEANISISF